MFPVGTRVELARADFKGTIVYDNGKDVRVKWDNGQIGDMIYDRNVCYNAFNLIPLKGEF